jgi:hypothetical protein
MIDRGAETHGSPGWRRRLATVLVCCLLPLVFSGVSDAGVGTFAAKADPATASSFGELLELREDQFTLKGSHGYEITVVGYLGVKPSITLYARRGLSEVEYTVPGKVTETELDATFGSLGSVDIHFEPSGQVREAISYCDSTHPTVAVDLGTFTGKIEFRGERGYTAVNTGRAQGGVGNDLALPGEPEEARCRATAAGGETVQKAEFTSLEAIEPKSRVQFTAIATTEVEGEEAGSPQTSRFILAADSHTKEKLVTIDRSVLTEAPISDFTFDAALDSATVGPASPFSGSARLRTEADGSSSWTGSLAAPVPGLGTVSLAGPAFRARFEQSNGTIIH